MTKKMISILTGLLLMFFVQQVNAQVLVEDFEYATGSLLTANGWTAHSGSGTQPVDVTTGLGFSGYKGSDVGGAANLDNTGEDVNKAFTAQTTGTLYVAAIVKIDAGGGGGYFFHLGKVAIGTAFSSRVWVNADGNGVGLTSGSTAPGSYAPVTTGVPFMIVLKYDFAAKKTSLYVMESFASAEPANPAFQIDETQTEIGSVALRQYSSTQRILVDGIRVGTNWAEAMAPAGVVTKVSTPNLNPGGGSFTAPVQVAISSATEGASIYYTLDGSAPDNTKTLYTAPLQITSTTTVKAIAYKTGLDASNVATATYSFPTEVATIAELRAHSSGLFKLTGEAILTFKTAERNAKYIQDATGGVLIDDAGGIIKTAYNIGDGITGITGTLGAYAGMLQFTPVADPGAATSTSNAITPKSVALEEMVNYPGQLVKISGVTIDGDGPFVVKTNYTLNGSSSTILRTAYNDLPYIDNSIPQGPQDITGVVLIFNNVTQLVPRTLADFSATVITSPTLIVTEVMPLFGVNLGQTLADTVYVDAFNLTGDVAINITGEGASAFSVSPAVLSPSNGTLNDAQVVITYNPAAAGDHVATLTFASAGAADVVKTLTGKAFSMNGDGSADRPFTVSDVIAMNNSLGSTQKHWVKGYIVGTATSGNAGVLTAVATTPPFSNTSLAIADAAAETSLAAMIPVQLPVGDIRVALNLLDNPGNLGKLVRVYGTLEAYFNTPGVRGVSEFSILTGLTPVDAARYRISAQQGVISIDAAEAASVEVFNTVGQLLYSGRVAVGQNSIRVNSAGIAIIKIDGAIGKVIL
jgi:hypothetical protein